MKNYKLLTPGPLTTTDTVKQQMMFDHCTWDDDYKKITLEIRNKLLKLAHVSEPEYTVVLMQGSGTFGVESVITSTVGKEEKLLIAANGSYGRRMADIAEHAGICYRMYEVNYNEIPDAEKIAEILKEDPDITHVSMVHSETTSGILNDIASVSKVVKAAGKNHDRGRHVQFWRRGYPGGRAGHRLHHKQRQQMYPGCAGILLHYLQERRPHGQQRQGEKPLFRPL